MTNAIACIILGFIFFTLGGICVAILKQGIEYKSKFQITIAIIDMIANIIIGIALICRGIWGV